MSTMLDRASAQARDAADPLRARREAFHLPAGVIYLDGNSLGALPRTTPARVAEVVARQWGGDLISSWNAHGWVDAAARTGARIAPLIGARAGEVIVADSTSVNLFKLLVACCQATPERRTILTEPGNFPTDLYIAQGVAATLPDRVVSTVPADHIADAIDDDVAVVLLTHVHYKTGRMLDITAITAAARAKGALVLWDLSHSVGAVDLRLDDWNVDCAVGCGYKYLNGGPGAPAFLFVAERLHDTLASPINGWFGHAAPFDFVDDYRPAPGIVRFQGGTPPILALAALDEGIAQFDGVDWDQVIAKSQALCDLYVTLVEDRCREHGFTLLTPRSAARRGSQVSFAHDHAHAICQALIARGVIGDFRAPDVLRMGFTPLYTGHDDVWRAVDVLVDIMTTRAWDDPRYTERAAVT